MDQLKKIGMLFASWLLACSVYGQKPIMHIQPMYLGNGTTVVDVIAYGADPTGTTDSATAINNTILACKTAGGGTVLIPAGTYLVASSISLALSGCNLEGDGMAVTTLKWTGTSGGTVLVATEWAYAHASDFTINGNSLAGIGIDFRGVNGTQVNIQDVIERIQVINCSQSPGYNIHVGDSSNNQISESTFRKILVSGGIEGIYQEGSQTLSMVYDGVSEEGANANDLLNIRAGDAEIHNVSGGSSPVTIRSSISILRLGITYAYWESQVTGTRQFFVMEDGTSNGNGGPFVSIDRLVSNCQSSTGNVKFIQWGVSTGSGGEFHLVRSKLDSSNGLTPACQISVTAPSGSTAFFAEEGNSYFGGPTIAINTGVLVQHTITHNQNSFNATGPVSAPMQVVTNGVGESQSVYTTPAFNIDRLTLSRGTFLAFSTAGAFEGAVGTSFYNNGLTLFGQDGSNTLVPVAVVSGASGAGLSLLPGFKYSFGAVNGLSNNAGIVTLGGVLGAKTVDNTLDDGSGNATFVGQVTSTKTTGTSPLVIASTTPVTNLTTAPATYNAAGTQQINTHIVEGTCRLGTSCSITLSGAAAYSTNFTCTASDATSANAVRIQEISGSAPNGLIFTGTGTDDIYYICIGY